MVCNYLAPSIQISLKTNSIAKKNKKLFSEYSTLQPFHGAQVQSYQDMVNRTDFQDEQGEH